MVKNQTFIFFTIRFVYFDCKKQTQLLIILRYCLFYVNSMLFIDTKNSCASK